MIRIILLITLLPILSFSQKPNKQGLIEYQLIDKNDSINFYIYNPQLTNKTKVFLFLQGSQPIPMISKTDSIECCFNHFPKSAMKNFPNEYAFIYIQKIGVPYYANTDHYIPSAKYNERNNVLDRADVANKVLNYVLKNLYPKANVVAVMGHSEGSDVAAKLAVLNKKITHLCFASGNGTPQIFNDVLFIRRKMHLGEISAKEAQLELDTLFEMEDRVFKEPNSTEKIFNGDTYKWHYAINQPAIENLLKLEIPIFLTIGSHDKNVPVESTDYIKSEFVRLQKNNLTYKVYVNSDHSYVERLTDGKDIDHWPELFEDYVDFIKNHDGR